MSGITGIITSSTEDLRLIGAMTDLLAHRGEHGEGLVWLQPDGAAHLTHAPIPSTASVPACAALGHRLHAGSEGSAPQPLASADGRCWITADATLYNAAILRGELEAAGIALATQSDAELILALYRLHGVSCFARLEGAWAVALLDLDAKQLHLARDGEGLRPLYYCAHRGRFSFASEIKALFAIPETRPRLERQWLGDFLRTGASGSEQRTAFAHILALPPGHALAVSFEQPAQAKPAPYAQNAPGSDPITAEGLHAAFLTAMARQSRSPLTVGASLSGGLASAALVRALREQLPPESLLNSFTAICDDPAHDEREWVQMANQSAHILSNLVTPHPDDFMGELDTLLWHQDEPFPGIDLYAQWCVARAAREAQVGVLLEAHGAAARFGLPQAAPGGLRRLFTRSAQPARVLARLAPSIAQGAAETPAPLPGPWHRYERNSAAFGVELRLPYLDTAMLRAAVRLPAAARQHMQSLRQALAPLVPPAIAARAPMPPYHLPEAAWIQSAVVPAFLRDIKLARLPLVPIVHGGELRELVTRQSERPDPALGPLLLRLFLANRWMQRFNVAPII